MSKEPVGDWALEGNCRGVDPDVMVPDDGVGTTEAKKVCDGCTVRAECLEYALTPPRERFGVWGGTSERERRKIEKQRYWARRMSA